MPQTTVRRQTSVYPKIVEDLIEQELNKGKEKDQFVRQAGFNLLNETTIPFNYAKEICALSHHGFGIYRLAGKEDGKYQGIWYLEEENGEKVLKKSVDDSEELELVQEYLKNSK